MEGFVLEGGLQGLQRVGVANGLKVSEFDPNGRIADNYWRVLEEERVKTVGGVDQ